MPSRIRQYALLLFASIFVIVELSSAGQKAAAAVKEGDDGQFITWSFEGTPMGLYLPDQTAGEPLPIVMFLHGCHNDPVIQYHWIITALNEIEPCAVFLPTAPETENTPYSCADWGGTYDSQLRPQMINALAELDRLIELHGFDTKRQYIYGESMGGEGVFRLIMDFPERFAGAVSAAGYTLDTGAAQMTKTPLWIAVGTDDLDVVGSSRAIYNSIVNAGGSAVEYTEYQGLGHVAGIEQARGEPQILQWLLSQNRSTAIIKKTVCRDNSFGTAPRFSFIDGSLRIFSSFPAGTIISLFNLNGQLLLETDKQCGALKLPAGASGRTIVWKASNAMHTVTGSTSLHNSH
ncbi:MAG: hypothetical protein GX556_02265 [Fibrobacter sp.]|nr:hypothetical protein [Fibrobacter sp.]